MMSYCWVTIDLQAGHSGAEGETMIRPFVFYTVLGACLASAAVATAQSPPTAPSSAKPLVIGMVQQVTHPALDASVRGMLDVLKEHGFEDGKQIKLDRQNAQNDLPTLAAIAKKFKDEKVDYVVAIGTLPLQNVWAVFKGTPTPVVFNAVTDPYAAGVAKSATDKGDNLTGIQASPPVAEALQLVLEVLPRAQKVGMIWTATEKNSEIATGRAREAAKALHVTLEEATISKADE